MKRLMRIMYMYQKMALKFHTVRFIITENFFTTFVITSFKFLQTTLVEWSP